MKMAKRTLSIVLALIMAFGVVSIASSAVPGPADYTAVNNAIATQLPSAANRYFYTDEAVALIDDVLNDLIDWNLFETDQATVDVYVTMINDLGSFINQKVTDSSQSPLVFAYGGGYSFPYTYPYGADGLDFYAFRAEEKAVNTLALNASKTAVPLVSRAANDQNFTVTLSVGSNALLCAGGIPVLFDKTKLEVAGVNNSGGNVTVTPVLLGSNISQEFEFTTILNPTSAGFWPAIYQADAAFKAKWGGISITMSTNFDNGAPYSVAPVGQENILSIQFKVKEGATAGNAVVFIDQNFARNAANKANSLYFGRGKDANAFVPYDALSAYGATINTAAASVSVEIVDVLLGDTNLSGTVTSQDALMALQAASAMITLTDKQKLNADVNFSIGGAGLVNSVDALRILQRAANLIPPITAPN